MSDRTKGQEKERDAPSELASWKAICSHRNCSQDATFPPPVSVLNAWRPLQRSHSASGPNALSMLFFTQSSCVPLNNSQQVRSIL